jgi:hypothetical protein
MPTWHRATNGLWKYSNVTLFIPRSKKVLVKDLYRYVNRWHKQQYEAAATHYGPVFQITLSGTNKLYLTHKHIHILPNESMRDI